MTITAASNKTPGLHHYYIKSDSGKDYVVTHVRRAGMNRWSCSCPNFIYRGQSKASHKFCKHLVAVREFVNHKQESTEAA